MAARGAAGGPALTVWDVQAIERRESWSKPLERFLGATVLGAVVGGAIVALWYGCDGGGV